MPSVFAVNKDTFCPVYDTVKIGAAAVEYKKLFYHWGDGKIDTVMAGDGMHKYQSGASYTIRVLSSNGVCTDTMYTKTIFLKTKPNVTISGNAYICGSIPTLLTGTSGGSSQWYRNGSIISGANSNTYFTATPGLYNMIKTNLNGCYDSASSSKPLLQGQADTSSFTVKICDNAFYLWNGVNRHIAGVYPDTFLNFMGCDSIVQLKLIVNRTDTSSYDLSLCENQFFVWNGMSQKATAGIYVDTFLNVFGCDSIVTMRLRVNSIATSTFTQSICSGESYFWNGIAQTVAGNYLDTFQTTLGCDSIVTLHLVVNPTSSSSFTQSICKGKSYLWNGIAQTVAGNYLDTFQNAFGCDSIVTLNLMMNPISSFTRKDTILSTQTISFNGMSLTSSGTYLDTLVNSFGCDSFLTLILTVNPVLGISSLNPVKVEIFPNPAREILYIHSDVLKATSSILRIYSEDGKLVYDQVRRERMNPISIPLTAWSRGIYILEIQNESEITKKRFVIEK